MTPFFMKQPYPHLLLIFCIAFLSCTQPQSADEAQTTTPTVPVSVETVAMKLKAESPDDLVRALYAAHKAGLSPFFQAKNRALVDRFFVDEIADLIWEDAVISDKSGEVAFMDADPLYNAQDMDIADFQVHPAEVDTDQAEVLVTFSNFGEKREFTFLLDREEGRWLISDLFYGDGSQLFQMLSGRAEEEN